MVGLSRTLDRNGFQTPTRIYSGLTEEAVSPFTTNLHRSHVHATSLISEVSLQSVDECSEGFVSTTSCTAPPYVEQQRREYFHGAESLYCICRYVRSSVLRMWGWKPHTRRAFHDLPSDQFFCAIHLSSSWYFQVSKTKRDNLCTRKTVWQGISLILGIIRYKVRPIRSKNFSSAQFAKQFLPTDPQLFLNHLQASQINYRNRHRLLRDYESSLLSYSIWRCLYYDNRLLPKGTGTF